MCLSVCLSVCGCCPPGGRDKREPGRFRDNLREVEKRGSYLLGSRSPLCSIDPAQLSWSARTLSTFTHRTLQLPPLDFDFRRGPLRRSEPRVIELSDGRGTLSVRSVSELKTGREVFLIADLRSSFDVFSNSKTLDLM